MCVQETHHSYLQLQWQQLQEGRDTKNQLGRCTVMDTGQHATNAPSPPNTQSHTHTHTLSLSLALSLTNTHTHTHTHSPLTLLFKACALLRVGSVRTGDTPLLSSTPVATAAGRERHKKSTGQVHSYRYRTARYECPP